MQPRMVETWQASEDMSCSIYRKDDESLTIWIKIGISLMEIPEKSFDTLSEFINFIDKRIKEINQ